MKKIFSFLFALMASSILFAQSSLVVTLSNGSNVRTFQGNTAFREALLVAKSGDVVTLSNGRFFAGEITKNIIIRGVGMSDCNTEGNVHGTSMIAGTMRINIPASETGRLRVEGVYLSDSLQYCTEISNASFEKCRFNTIRPKMEGVLKNCNFLHCRIADSFLLSAKSQLNMSNCVIWNPCNAKKADSGFEFTNCMICFTYTWTFDDGKKSYYAGCVENSTYKNSIIDNNGTTQIPNSCMATYCLGTPHSVFDNLAAPVRTTCKTIYSFDSTPSALKTFRGRNYSDTETFEFRDENKAKYIGSDGTEIGIHGGSLPYDENPVRPQLLDVTVSKNTDEDGFLSVTIQAKDAEY